MKFLAGACFLVALVSAGCAEMDQPVESADSTRTTLQAYTVDSETGIRYGVEMTFNTVAIDRADAELLLDNIRVEHNTGLSVADEAETVIIVDASNLSASEIGYDEVSLDMALDVTLVEWVQIDNSRWADLIPEEDSEIPVIEFCPPGH